MKVEAELRPGLDLSSSRAEGEKEHARRREIEHPTTCACHTTGSIIKEEHETARSCWLFRSVQTTLLFAQRSCHLWLVHITIA